MCREIYKQLLLLLLLLLLMLLRTATPHRIVYRPMSGSGSTVQ